MDVITLITDLIGANSRIKFDKLRVRTEEIFVISMFCCFSRGKPQEHLPKSRFCKPIFGHWTLGGRSWPFVKPSYWSCFHEMLNPRLRLHLCKAQRLPTPRFWPIWWASDLLSVDHAVMPCNHGMQNVQPWAMRQLPIWLSCSMSCGDLCQEMRDEVDRRPWDVFKEMRVLVIETSVPANALWQLWIDADYCLVHLTTPTAF